IMEPILKDCIPIYWGNKLVDRDFNSQRFLDYNQFKSEEDLIEKILEINQNEDSAIDMIQQPPFSPAKMTHNEEHQQVLEIISKIVEENKKPMAVRWLRYLHGFNLFCSKIQKRVFTHLSL
ncbi:hypothetical protein, partial [Flavobacterium bomense]